MTQSFGRMDEGYFLSRQEIFTWINQTLPDANITLIESLGTGIIYCRLFDIACPGSINLTKLNLRAKLEYDYLENLKILQLAFTKIGLTKTIDIKKLAKCKFQDNWEFIQWLKLYIEHRTGMRTNRSTSSLRSRTSSTIRTSVMNHSVSSNILKAITNTEEPLSTRVNAQGKYFNKKIVQVKYEDYLQKQKNATLEQQSNKNKKLLSEISKITYSDDDPSSKISNIRRLLGISQ